MNANFETTYNNIIKKIGACGNDGLSWTTIYQYAFDGLKDHDLVRAFLKKQNFSANEIYTMKSRYLKRIKNNRGKRDEKKQSL